MEIGLSSASFYPYVNTEDSISLMKSLGFNTGEIFLNSPSEYEADFIKKLVYEKEEKDFKINSVHGFSGSFEPYLFDSYKRRALDMREYFKQVCAAGKALGAECYTFHGLRLDNLNNLDIKRIIEVYDELIYIASEAGIKLAQENVCWCMSSNLEFLSLLKEKCKNPLYFTIDIKQAYKAGIEPEKYVEIMAEKICNFHINDRDNEKACMLPGKGNVKYIELVNKLMKYGYNGKGIIEVYRENYCNYDELTKVKDYLTELLS